jgi:hypothetical protein
MVAAVIAVDGLATIVLLLRADAGRPSGRTDAEVGSLLAGLARLAVWLGEQHPTRISRCSSGETPTVVVVGR